MAGVEKKVKFIEAALIQNDVLRPWTIDINLERRLQQEASALDKVLSFTTPQKFAGTLCSSVIDSVPEELRHFQNTINLRVTRVLNGLPASDRDSYRQRQISGVSGEPSPISSLSKRSNSSNALSRPSSHTSHASALASARDYDDADLEYIDRLKRSMYLKSKHTRAQSAYAHRSISGTPGQNSKSIKSIPINAIRYSTAPFGPISPNKSKLMLMPHAPVPGADAYGVYGAPVHGVHGVHRVHGVQGVHGSQWVRTMHTRDRESQSRLPPRNISKSMKTLGTLGTSSCLGSYS
jgi:hypothetical protein